MTFPIIDPVLVEIGPLVIRWYALAYIAGIVGGWWLAAFYIKRMQLWAHNQPVVTKTQLDDAILWLTFGIIIGGRLGFVLFYAFDYYVNFPLDILKVWQGGMSFHGGLLGAGIAAYLFSKRNEISVLSFSDLACCVAPIGLFFGRIANFINGELWGRVTTSSWGVVFPDAGPFPRHPSQLYEAALEGLLLFVILQILVWRGGFEKRGFISGVFLCGYALTRSFCELFREPDAQLGFIYSGLTMGMLLSLPLFIIGLYLIVQAFRHDRSNQIEEQ